MAKNRDKQKYVYSDYGIIFLGVGVWGFVDDSAKNAIFLVLVIVHHLTSLIAKIITILIILGLLKLKAVLALKKEISVNFNKAKTKLFLNLHCNGNSSYLFIKGKEIYQIKTDNKKVHFLTQFCPRSISKAILMMLKKCLLLDY